MDAADQIAFLATEPECRAIACVLEGVPDTRRLVAAGRLARHSGKPVVAFKIARTQAGAEAAIAHTATLAGSDEGYRAVFRRAGIVVVDDLEHLLDTASFFAKAVALGGAAPGLAVLSGSGGSAIMAADQAALAGVALPPPSEAVRARLVAAIPEFGSPRNPCDLTAQVSGDPASLVACAEAMAQQSDYGALVHPHHVVGPDATDRQRLLDTVAKAHGKINCAVWLSDWLEGEGAREVDSWAHTAVFRSMRACMRALAARAWWQSLSAEPEITPDPAAQQDLRARAAAALGDATGVLAEADGLRLLQACGIPAVRIERAATADDACTAAARIGFPVALKVSSPDPPHKTEAGGVVLLLGDAADVRDAYARIMARVHAYAPSARIDGVVVQPMLRSGVELVLGMKRDPTFGPMLIVGLGGVLVELIGDVAVRLAPVGPDEALDMLGELRTHALLDGYRSGPKVDRVRLAAVISDFSRIASTLVDRIVEIEINLLISHGERVLAADALVRLG